MKFYSKLVLHFLNDEISKLQTKYQQNEDVLKDIKKFDVAMFELLYIAKESTSLIHKKLYDLVNAYSFDRVLTRLKNHLPGDDNPGKMSLIIEMIKKECDEASLSDIEYDDSDPASIFQYQMLKHIIEDKVNDKNELSDLSLKTIKDQFNGIQIQYSTLPSRSEKIDFILYCLKNISNQDSLPKKDHPPLPMPSFFGGIVPKNPEMKPYIDCTYREVERLKRDPQTQLSIKEESIRTNSNGPK